MGCQLRERQSTIFIPHSKHLIAGEWVVTQDRFDNDPVNGQVYGFSVGNPIWVDIAGGTAEAAF